MNRLNELYNDRTFTIRDNTARMMNAMLNPEMTTVGAIGEIADNSFEYGATQLDITINREENYIEFSDNGPGCVDRDILLGQAQSGKKPTTTKHNIGNYGIGLKDALGFFGGRVFYDSMNTRGKRVGFYVDYSENVLQKKRFAYETASTRTEAGLTLRCVDVYWDRVSATSALTLDLAVMFKAALDEGIIITLNGEKLNSPLEIQYLPNTETVGKGTFPYKNIEKPYRFGFGLTAPGFKQNRGWTIRLGYRTLLSDYVQHGFKNYSSTGFYGWIELGNNGQERWRLNRHKNNFDELVPFLEGEMFNRIEALLIRLQSEAEKIVFPSVLNHQYSALGGNKDFLNAAREITGTLNGKPKRKKRQKPASVPGETEIKLVKPRKPPSPLNLRKVTPRKYRLQDKRSAIEIQFAALGIENEMIVMNPKEETILVQINTDHPGGLQLQKDPEREEAKIVAEIFATVYCELNQLKEYPFYNDRAANPFINLIRNFAFLMTDHKNWINQLAK